MKAEKLDRVYIAVKDLDKAAKFFSEILGTTFADPPFVKDEVSLRTAFSPIGVQLIEPTSPKAAVAKFIDNRGEGMFGLCFKVSNLDEAVAALESRGIRPVTRVGEGKLMNVQFHPKDCFGVSLVLTAYPEKHGAEVAGREIDG